MTNGLVNWEGYGEAKTTGLGISCRFYAKSINYPRVTQFSIRFLRTRTRHPMHKQGSEPIFAVGVFNL